jgi:copper oxidase (laccase) domain-containing protein
VKRDIFVAEVSRELGISAGSLLLPQQTHSSNVWVLSEDDRGKLKSGALKSVDNCDAIICSRRAVGCAIGVQSADCAPILGATEHEVFAIHAGWVGLRDEIIGKTLVKLVPYSKIEFFVGPCAVNNYERDLSEIESIPHVIYAEGTQGKGNLNVKETAVNQIEGVISSGVAEFSIVVAPECTLSNQGWLSYRRSSIECQRKNIEGGFAKVRAELSVNGFAVNNISCIQCF